LNSERERERERKGGREGGRKERVDGGREKTRDFNNYYWQD
jgi:hypothetical protein